MHKKLVPFEFYKKKKWVLPFKKIDGTSNLSISNNLKF